MICPICKNQSADNALFCTSCGKQIPRCPTCGKPITDRKRAFCTEDGTKIPPEILALLPADAAFPEIETPVKDAQAPANDAAGDLPFKPVKEPEKVEPPKPKVPKKVEPPVKKEPEQTYPEDDNTYVPGDTGSGKSGGTSGGSDQPNKMIGILIMVVILLLAAVIYLLFFRGKNEPKNTATTQTETTTSAQTTEMETDEAEEAEEPATETTEESTTVETTTEETTTVETTTEETTTEETTTEPALSETDQRILDLILACENGFIRPTDLYGCDADMCRKVRNGVYARKGRKFQDPALTEYFSQFDWYLPTIDPDNFNDNMLNAYQIENLKTIVSYEKEMGYR
ncbi:MAG: YARHG domain-containing protein [Lachnospiraceae bacterium]|nr:YARHG domain-containing protein [Lachnospiraceae bacterium]